MKHNPFKTHTIISISLLLVCLCFDFSLFAKNKLTTDADKDFNNHKYEIAIEKYKKALSKLKNDPEEKNRINFQLSECYRLTNNYRLAVNQYKRLVRVKYQEKKPIILLYYAESLKLNNNHAEAKEKFQEYLSVKPKSKRALNGMIACDSITSWLLKPTKHQIQTLAKINSRESDFAPTYGNRAYNTIIFTSTRKEAIGKNKDEWTGQKFSDLFVSRIDQQGKWSKPALLDNEDAELDNNNMINTPSNEGTPFLNKSFNRIYFTRCPNDHNNSGCKIYTSKRIGKTWSRPQLLVLENDTSYVYGHPTLSSDERTIYFVSDRPGGKGGKDIWVAERKSKNGKFGRPRNLGSEINTEGDEVFPFLRNDSLLYFSSNGHISLGGLDIFVTRKNGFGNWEVPENLKYPMNSYRDDFGIVFHKELEEGFFSSNRKGSKDDDIYFFKILPVEFTLQGQIINRETDYVMEGVKVKLHGSDGSTIQTLTNKAGKYIFNPSQLKKNLDYELKVSFKGHFNATDKISTYGFEESHIFEKNFKLQEIPKEPIVLPDILYDLGKWDLKPQYQDSLQGLIRTLEQNENIVIELASHTDSRDTDEYNNILSQKRAKSVVDYLILRGINPKRLVPKGYGEQQPRKLKRRFKGENYNFKAGSELNEAFISSLKNETEKEAAHQLNRRTEFSVLKTDFSPYTPETGGLKKYKPKKRTIPYTIEKDGSQSAKCILNEEVFTFIYKEDVDAEIPLRAALILLNEGIINESDFLNKEDLKDGSIRNGAEFYINTLKIANKTVRNLSIKVNNRLKDKLILGESTLIMFGLFNFDPENKIIIFK